MMKDRDKAYIAGIVDGEGSLMIVMTRGKLSKTDTFYPKCTIATINEDLMQYLDLLIHGNAFKRPAQKSGNFDTYHFSVYGKHCVKLLKDIKEYMIIKRSQAELLVRFYDEFPRWNGGGTKKPQIMEARQALWHQAVKHLNHARNEQANQLLETASKMMPCSELYGNIESNQEIDCRLN